MPRTLAQNAQYIANTIKPAIKSAIEAQGVTVPSTDSFLDYADRIAEIEGGGSGYQLKDLPTGSISTVNDAAPLPLNALKVSVEAVQDLHGYDHPWVGGAGKNKLPLTVDDIKSFNTSAMGFRWEGNSCSVYGITFELIADDGNNLIGIKATGTASGNATLYVYGSNTPTADAIIYDNAMMCTMGLSGSPSTYRGVIWKTVGEFLDDQPVPMTAGDTLYGFGIRVHIGYAIPSSGIIFKPMVRLATETDPTFEPYSNICPIIGWDSGEITVVGKNYAYNNMAADVDFNGVKWEKQADGSIKVSGTATANSYVINAVRADIGDYNGNIIVSGLNGVNNITIDTIPLYDKDNNLITSLAGGTADKVIDLSQYDGVRYLSITYKRITNSAVSGVIKPQIELGTTATTYEPYQGKQYTQQFPTTIYGGEWDVVNGVLSQTDGYIASYNGESLPSTWISDRDVYASGTTPTIGAEVVYRLATPTIINQQPLSIRLLENTNNIYADCGEVIEGEYFSGSAKGYVDGIKYAGEGDGGIASYMNVKSADELLGATAITFEVYARIDSYVNKTSGAYARLMEFGNSQQSGRLGFVGLASDNDNNLCYWDDVADIASGIDTWTLGDIHLISVVKTTAGALKIYVDGVLKYTGSSTLSITTSIIDYVTERGGYSSQVDSARQLNGEVYAWRVYAKELSAANIAQNLTADRSLYAR